MIFINFFNAIWDAVSQMIMFVQSMVRSLFDAVVLLTAGLASFNVVLNFMPAIIAGGAASVVAIAVIKFLIGR